MSNFSMDPIFAQCFHDIHESYEYVERTMNTQTMDAKEDADEVIRSKLDKHRMLRKFERNDRLTYIGIWGVSLLAVIAILVRSCTAT